MDSKTVVSAILAVSLSTGGLALAQGRGGRNDHNDRGRNEQAQRGNDGRQYDRGYSDNGRHEGRGAGPNRNFYKGAHLPMEYRHRNYVVDDWRSHNLRAPPRGYHWVQTGADYVLVAIATGIILQLFLQND